MILRLTDTQLRQVHEVAGPVHERWLEHPERTSKRMVEIGMPAIGWEQLANRLSKKVFNLYGQRLTRVPGPASTALRRIRHKLAWLQAHPAMVGIGLPGHDATLLSAWKLEGTWFHLPTAGEHVVLEPNWYIVRDVRTTLWHARPERGSDPYLVTEAAAMEFNVRSSSAGQQGVS